MVSALSGFCFLLCIKSDCHMNKGSWSVWIRYLLVQGVLTLLDKVLVLSDGLHRIVVWTSPNLSKTCLVYTSKLLNCWLVSRVGMFDVSIISVNSIYESVNPICVNYRYSSINLGVKCISRLGSFGVPYREAQYLLSLPFVWMIWAFAICVNGMGLPSVIIQCSILDLIHCYHSLRVDGSASLPGP